MRDVILDFETYRWGGDLFEDLLKDTVAGVTAPGNYKKKESIEKYLKEERIVVAENFREKAATNPLTGRLLAASLAVERYAPDREASSVGIEELDGRWEFHYLLAKTDEEEVDLIKKVDMILAEIKPRKVVTFSGRDFDIPFYIGRAIINDQPLRFTLPSYKYDRMHFDLRDALPKGPLEHWLRAATGEGKNGSGAMVDGWVKTENWAALEEYCQDIRQVAVLWERVRNVIRVS